MPMPRGRHCWSAREAIARGKKPPADPAGQGQGQGLAPLRFASRGDGARRQKSVQDLERGWDSSCAPEPGTQPRSPPYGFRDRWFRTDAPRPRPRAESAKRGNSSGARAQQLDRIYGKRSAAPGGGGKLPLDPRGASRRRDGDSKPRSLPGLSLAQLLERSQSPSPGDGDGDGCNSGKTTARSDRYLDGVWVRSPRGPGAEVQSSLTARAFGEFDDFSRSEHERDFEADSGWMGSSTRSPRRETVPRAKTADDVVAHEIDDPFRESSWLRAFQDGQRREREMYGLRRFSTVDFLGRSVPKVADDLSWAANCRAKLKPQVIA
ncbi:hypothetical protein MPTK1_4g16540 [Marchantia polymorpha subsp. ruderalis]